ncbi:MAG: hypothetical protein F4073_07590 [Rhodobacteraceae bacterium]|nr:hypothetical protein [Paracoccaceae bacterium]MYI91801.1 hypothetical protein [Paracoccaceae bacterium]
MAVKKRGLSGKFIDVFNQTLKQKEWLRKLVDDEDIFCFIRDEYINFYYLGCSILKLELDNTQWLTGKTHYKYLLNPILEKTKYFKIINSGEYDIKEFPNPKLQNIHEIKSLKDSTIPHAKPEKVESHEIIKKNLNIIDIEIAVGRRSFIDLAAIKKSGEGAEVTFYEVKLLKNKDLRNGRIYGQMQKYSNWIKENRKQLTEIYLKVCKNSIELERVSKSQFSDSTRELIKRIANNDIKLSINPEPELIVTGIDQNKKNDDKWKPYQEELAKKFGERYKQEDNSSDVVL